MDSSLNPETSPRLQRLDKAVFLSLCPLFAGLTQWELKSISQLMRLVEYKKEEVVYREGEGASSFYVVVSGRFEASTGASGKKRVMAYLKRGDYFGEMSLLTAEPHSATLRAISDALVLELKKDDFAKMIEHNAHVSLEMSRRLSLRLKRGQAGSEALWRSDVVSIFSPQRRVGRTVFSINLAAALFIETRQKTVLLDMSPTGSEISSRLKMAQKVPITRFHGIETASFDALSDCIVRHPVGFEVLNVAHKEEDPAGAEIIAPLLNHLAVAYRFIVIDLPPALDETVEKALTQSDWVYFVTDSHLTSLAEAREILSGVEKSAALAEGKLSVVIHEASVWGARTTSAVKREFFEGRLCYSLPATPELEEHEERHESPFAAEFPDAEYSRVVYHVARRISGNLVGLALGSGAALGLAHIGVLKALEREKIPIDMIAGSSIGALVGSLYAIGKRPEELEKMALGITKSLLVTRLLDFHLFPLRGLLAGRRIMRHFQSHLSQKTFEDCNIPLKIAAVNLSSRRLHLFESGPIAPAVRASIAIPAIFDPVVTPEGVLVDGGVIDPLPIRVLYQAGVNKVIAVNVLPTAKDVLEKRLSTEEVRKKEEAAMAERNGLVRGWFHAMRFLRKCFVPNVFDILMTTMQAMEYEIAEVEGEEADVLIRPVVPTASWVEFYRAKPLIERGEEETMKLLPKIKALVSAQNV
ncbi:MAG: cyclic nucleotide-binding domain-containing protein [Candidatus Omnitrophica bacterium]|nr:cyclic nucleotide-binding domain-containing protein [Candidatus Omnitrophota bacterium]